ncbi:DDE-type integrase/transposase/recombinase [Lactiplantibacillus plantarum]|uniref:DDE-type integrase/transposase/recombinase n=1 Tax=Lactiplantibacillus plantarum TaxID=1590 RepID=UPI001CC24E99|nr:DDE-type integrase/transposase/recombinase [Lactiplantibacillus plantarum]
MILELGLRCQVRPKKRSRIKQQDQYVRDNLLNQNFDVDAPNQVWLSDSTELAYGVNGEHKIRLGGVMDLYDRRILAYNLSITETSAAEIQVFQRSFATARNVHPMIHTDHGSAYTSGAFNHYLPANLRSHAVCHVTGHHMTMRQWNVGGMNLNYVGW